MGSLVTDLDLGDHPLVTVDELCLLKAGKKCGKCIKACPADALSEDGMDRAVCYARLQENYRLLMEPDGLPESTEVCAKCQVGMPCSIKSPLPDRSTQSALVGLDSVQKIASSGWICSIWP